MIKYILNKIKEYLKSEWKFLMVLLTTFILCTYPVDYYIITGGGTILAKDRVEVEGAKKSKGTISLTYVKELKGTIATYLLSYIVPSYEREKVEEYTYNENETIKDVEFRSNIQLKTANNSAIKVAYEQAGKKIKENSKGIYVYYIDKKADTNLKIGDKIIEINGKKVGSFKELRKYINTLENNSEISILVENNNKKETKTAKLFEEENNKYIGVSLIEDVSYQTNPKLNIKFKKSEGGPSGGFMMTLEIYNQLTKKDITKGKKIAGTGTIDEDGNIGEIDGIKYKLKGAVKKKSDIFIAPTGKNYNEAVKEKEKHGYKIRIIEGKTFNQVVEELDKIK